MPPTRHSYSFTRGRAAGWSTPWSTRIDSLAKARTVPQCTHMTVTRVHGDQKCDSCGKLPSLGWLYCCTQDATMRKTVDFTSKSSLDDISTIIDDAQAMQALGVSESVVSQCRDGLYTPSQMQTIKDQKRLVNKLVSDAALASMRLSTAINPDIQQQQQQHPQVLAKGPANVAQGQGLDWTPRRAMKEPHPTNVFDTKRINGHYRLCQYKCCHRCRSFLHDRLYTSIDAVLKGEESPITNVEAQALRVLDSEVLKHIGLRSPAPPSGNTPRSHDSDSREPSLNDLTHSVESINIEDIPFLPPQDVASSTPQCSSGTSQAHTDSSSYTQSSISLSNPSSSSLIANEDRTLFTHELRKADTWHDLSHRRLTCLNHKLFSPRAASFPNDARVDDSESNYSSSTDQSVSGCGGPLELRSRITMSEESIESHLPDVAITDTADVIGQS
ncbi:hypothetical protein ANO11243_070180 [Dothideomycetidae sp. 11243]|nr:hypothetical protein ANO11243_070180 [fungal sp. No.11243]